MDKNKKQKLLTSFHEITSTAQFIPIGLILSLVSFSWMPLNTYAQTQTSYCETVFGSGVFSEQGAVNDVYDVPANAVNFTLSPSVISNDAGSIQGSLNEIVVSSQQATVIGTEITYTPTPGVGSTTETFTYAVRYLTELCADATVTINIGPLTGGPNPIEAMDDDFTIDLNSGPVNFNVLANDTGDDITVLSVSPTSNGGSVSVLSNDDIQYTPPAPLPDDFVDTFDYTIGQQSIAQPLANTSNPNTALVTVRGPKSKTPTTNIKARNDRFQVTAANGPITLNVLTNDTPQNNVHIFFTGGNTQGNIAVVENGKRIAYNPPPNLVNTIVERFNYDIVDNDDNSLRSRAQVELTVVGSAGTGNIPNQPLSRVPTSSIGKIKSDLPVARAVENLCDLLTYRAANSSTRGQLSTAQLDLQTCACAIVNEGNVSAQRSAVNQLSGGQHQFSDTVMRFAKGSSGVILKRMANIRKQSIAHTTRSTGNALASSNLADQLLAELPQYAAIARNQPRDNRHEKTSLASDELISNDVIVGTYGASNKNKSQHTNSIFDNLILGKNSVYFSAPLGGSAGDGESGLFGDQAGVFTSITTGSGDNDEGEFNFDFDSYDITTGIDYTRPGTDRTRVYGGALSIGKVETDSSNGGDTSSDSIGVTLYGSLFKADGWFADGAIGYSKSDIDIERVISFTASGKTVLQTSNGDTNGEELSLSVGGGKEINLGANNILADIRLRYIDGSIDGLTERIGIANANGAGLALQTDDFDITSFRSELGLQINRTIGTRFGVMVPFFSANWIHEFEDRGSDIRARFLVDAYSDGFNQLTENAPGGSNRPTLFVIPGAENDSDYALLSVGSSFAFTKGRSAWLSFSSVTGLSGINNDQISAGFRWELGN